MKTKKYRLTKKAKVLLGALGFVLIIVLLKVILTIVLTKTNSWYTQCDRVYGRTTTYYECRQYYIKGDK